MHPEADAFLDAIFDNPDDDTVRLVYADWLQEHGQENFAQFIRLQCAAAREKLWSDEANRLWEEIGRVWTKLDDEWWPATRENWQFGYFPPVLLDAIHFERGFLRFEMLPTDDQFLAYAAVCWPWFPHPDVQLLLTPKGRWHELASCERLRRVRHIRLAVRVEVDDIWDAWWISDKIILLLHSPHLCNVETIDFVARGLTPSVVNALLTSPHLSKVRRLDVHFYSRGHPDEPFGPRIDQSETLLNLESRFKNVYSD